MLQQVKLEATSYSGANSATSSASSSVSAASSSGDRGNMAGSTAGLVDMNNNPISGSHSPHSLLQQYYSTMQFAAGTASPYANLIGLPPPTAPAPTHQHLPQTPAAHQIGQLDSNFYMPPGINNLLQSRTATPSLCNVSMSGSSDDVNQCDYLQKLLEERDKLRELINEPFNLFLPLCTRFVEEGKSTCFF